MTIHSTGQYLAARDGVINRGERWSMRSKFQIEWFMPMQISVVNAGEGTTAVVNGSSLLNAIILL